MTLSDCTGLRVSSNLRFNLIISKAKSVSSIEADRSVFSS
jgi:hypothetical protein